MTSLHNTAIRPVEIAIGSRYLTFCSLTDFEFCLEGRTTIPAKRIIQTAQLSAIELKQRARTIKNIETRFAKILYQTMEQPGSISRAIDELDTLAFSRDHKWRTIIVALRNSEQADDRFKRIALIKYTQYLASLQAMIKCLYLEKKKYQKNIADPDDDDVSLLDFETDDDEQMERMPKGETVTLAINRKRAIRLLLSTHKCKLRYGDAITFTDPAGRRHRLKPGKNIIGRDQSSDVIIDHALIDVSRLHLIVYIDADNRIKLTDLSSHGSYIAAKYLPAHGG